MESSSKIHGEECESSESGWTMYIASSIDDDDDDDDGGVSDVVRRKTVVDDDDVDTDDSMASDASSGPGLQVCEDHGKYNISSKKYKKAVQKKKVGCEEGKKDYEKEVVNDNKGVVSTHQSRNSGWFRGRKK